MLETVFGHVISKYVKGCGDIFVIFYQLALECTLMTIQQLCYSKHNQRVLTWKYLIGHVERRRRVIEWYLEIINR